MYLVIITLCIIISAYFSATETAFNSVNKIKIKSKADNGNKRAVLVLKLLDNYDDMLSSILIGNNIVNILASSAATIYFVNNFGEDLGAMLSTCIITILLLIFGEISPKSIAKEKSEDFCLITAPLLSIIIKVMMPLNFIFGLWKFVLSKLIKPSDDDNTTEEEVIAVIDSAAQDGEIDKDERVMLHNVIEFNDIEVRDIMTPRLDIVGVDKNSSVDVIRDTFINTGYSRLPIYDGDLDNIKGVVNLKDFNKNKNIEEIIRPVIFVPEHKLISNMLRELQDNKRHIAIIVDEFGAVIGMVTLEDIVEEIVGDIWDEHEEVIGDIEKINDYEYRIRGSANIEEVFDSLNIENEEEVSVTTIGGWVMQLLDKIPKVGDKIRYNNLMISVLKMDDNKVDTLKVVKAKK